LTAAERFFGSNPVGLFKCRVNHLPVPARPAKRHTKTFGVEASPLPTLPRGALGSGAIVCRALVEPPSCSWPPATSRRRPQTPPCWPTCAGPVGGAVVRTLDFATLTLQEALQLRGHPGRYRVVLDSLPDSASFPWETDMSSTAPSGLSKSIAVTVLGLLTLLWGGAHAAWGGWIIFAGADLGVRMQDDAAAGGFAYLLRLLADFMIVVGVAVLLQGALGMLAGWGDLLHKPWGRILTFIVAVLAILWGLLFLSGYQRNVDSEIALGAAQVLYGVLALVILITNGAEFSRLRGRRAGESGRPWAPGPRTPTRSA
jgi:hypothetical protein